MLTKKATRDKLKQKFKVLWLCKGGVTQCTRSRVICLACDSSKKKRERERRERWRAFIELDLKSDEVTSFEEEVWGTNKCYFKVPPFKGQK